MSVRWTSLFKMDTVKIGFEPVFNQSSKVLILGSFPSVKSREVEFYYGHKQNRFWKTVCGFFGDEIPQNIEEKKQFLLKRGIALWDIVTECEIVGSQDVTIKNYKTANLENLLQNSEISFIILNGSKAYSIFYYKYANLEVPYIKLPSTSPANVRFSEEEWYAALSRVFG